MMNMKQFKIGIYTLLIHTACTHAHAVTPYFSIRSQGLNTPRHISGLVHQSFTQQSDVVHGTISTALEYSRSFDGEEITNCLFGTKECPAITISGSRVSNRGATDWLADYFYLPTDFKSNISFNPVVDNILLDFNFYIGLDEWFPGLYITLYAPLVHSRWNLRMCESFDAKGTNTHDPGYFTPDTLQRNELLNDFTEYANGTIVGPITQTVAGTDFTTTFQPLQKAKLSSRRLNRTRVADVRAAVGYNFVQKDRCHIALQGLVSAPSGTRPEGQFLFEPVIGNSHHWELGGGFVGSCTMWRSDDEETRVILFGDVSFTHLFASRQRRTFDLKNKPFSRYMLIERLGTPITDNLQGGGTAPSAQFKQEVLPVANLTNVSIDTKIPLQAELTACITFVRDRFSWNLGYNLWGRTCEQIKLHTEHPFENNTQWALKGDAHVYGFDRGSGGSGALVCAIPLSATQNTATIYGGNNFISTNSVATAKLNPGIDRPRNATGDSANATADYPLSSEPHSTAITIQTSIEPLLLQSTNLDICEHTTSALSSKIFTHFSYTWNDHEQWIPYVGIGGQAEFSHNNNGYWDPDCNTECDSCIRCTLSQWGIWFKGGLTF